MLGRFMRRYPGIALHMHSANTGDVASAVLEGTVDLGLVEGRGARDLRDEADQVAVQQHLGRQGRRPLVTPDRLAPAADHDADSEDVDARGFQVRVDAAVSQSVDDAPGTILVHGLKRTVPKYGIGLAG